ncbi:MAG: sensor histidine kinase, partial [Actinomycetota bacterium]
RGIRAPRQMLVVDVTLVGATLFGLPGPVMAAFVGLLAMAVTLFAERWWRAGLLLYLTVWYTAAFVGMAGFDSESLLALIGSLFAIATGVALMLKLRSWIGSLDANRSQMLGTVSHELRNNLTGVLGLTDVVSTMEELEPAEAKELITMANQQALDASEIVEDLLTASRLERAVLTTSSDRVNVNPEIVTTARRFQGAGTDIVLLAGDELPEVGGDALRIRQILRNLVSNAIRYGGPEIRIVSRAAGDAVEVIVRDNGDGVPPEDERSIFLPYRRSTTGRRDASSVGLGLWICHQLAAAMGGRLHYRRRDGWTEFVLTLPAAAAHADPTAAAAKTADQPARLPPSDALEATWVPIASS